MPRNGSGVMSKVSGTTAVAGTTIESAKYNSLVDDIITDLNTPRPIVAGGTGASTAAAARTALGIDTSTFQPLDAGLTSIAGLTTAADRMIYTTASDTYAVATLTAAGRAILDDADAAAQRTTLGLAIGTDVQAQGATLTSLEGLTLAAGDILYATGADTLVKLPIGTAGQVLWTNAGATAPEWATAPGGTTLLGTINTTSGSSQSLSSLDLTPYKLLKIVLSGVSTAASSGFLELNGIRIFASIGSAADTIRGVIDVDLADGTFIGSVANIGTNNFTNAPYVVVGDNALTTASTAVTIACTVGSFDAGSVRVYAFA